MTRAVLDTSVLVSSFLTPQGAPGAILDAAERGDFTMCLSMAILGETAHVLTRNRRLQARYQYDHRNVAVFCQRLRVLTEPVTNLPDLTGVVPLDPKDDVIVATAVAAQADDLVTGDRRHLLALGMYEGIRIVTPRAFLTAVGEHRQRR